MEPIIASPCFLLIAECFRQSLHILLLHMDPADQLGIRALTAAYYPGGGTFQIGDLNVIVLPDAEFMELFRAQ